MNLRVTHLQLARVPYDGPRTGTHLVLELEHGETAGVSYVSFAGEGTWSAKALQAAVDMLLERISDVDVLDAEAVSRRMLDGGGVLSGLLHRAASLIDVALWDIRGKMLGRPVYQLLGGATDRVRVYGGWKLWSQLDLDTVARNATWFAEQGFTAIKFRLGGIANVREAVERTRRIREAAGPGVDLLADVNQTWDVRQALRIAPELEQFGLFYLEDPVPHADYESLARIAEAIDTPLAAGESYHDVGPFRQLLERRALDVVMVDLNVGGLTPWMKIAHLAEAFGRPIVSHLCPEILAHGVAAARNGLILEYLPWALPLWKEPPSIKDGFLQLGDKPGLGIELDGEALDRYSIN